MMKISNFQKNTFQVFLNAAGICEKLTFFTKMKNLSQELSNDFTNVQFGEKS